jgi:stearoyl-CoA desaturase (delta-9 desaturase)
MTVADNPTRRGAGGTPVLAGRRAVGPQIAVHVFVIAPLLALVAASRSRGAGADVVLALVFYLISGLGITVGYHRYFTHGSFRAVRPLRIAPAVAGSLAMQGQVIDWVADHRRHHA